MATFEGQKHMGVNTLFYIPGKVGGSETYLLESLRAMLPLSEARFTLFTNSENDGLLRDCFGENSRVNFNNLAFCAENRYQRILREQFQLPARVRQAGCDVLWSPGYTASLLTRCPQAVSILDMQYRRFPRDLSPLGWLATHVLVTLGAKRCPAIMTLTKFSKTEIVKFLEVASERVTITYAGVGDLAVPKLDEAKANRRQPYLLCVANSYPHKNLPALIAAFDALADTMPHRLVLVSRAGRGERDLEHALAKARFRDRIERLGGVSEHELACLYQNAALFILPSRYEGFGLPLIEAMQAGVPVVAANCASLPEVGGDGALFFDPDEPHGLEQVIKEVLAFSAEERAQLIARGHRQVATFVWEATARRILDVLQKIT